MNKVMLLSENLINLNETGQSNEEVLRHCVEILIKENCVTEEYINQVLSREKQFPTGLHFEDISVALAHGDPIGVQKSSIVFARLANHPKFGLMDNPETMIPVDAVIMLAVNDPDSHIKVIANLMNSLQKKQICDCLLHSQNKAEICTVMNNELSKEIENNE